MILSFLLQAAAHQPPPINQSLCLHCETAAPGSSAHPTVHVGQVFSHMESKCKLSLPVVWAVIVHRLHPSIPDCSCACSDRLPSPPVSHMCEKPLACQICVYAFTWSCVANLCESACTYLFSLKKVRVGGCLSVCVHIHTLKSDFTGYIQAVLIVCLRWSIFCYYCPIMPLSCERIPLNNLNYTIRALKQPWYPEKTFT